MHEKGREDGTGGEISFLPSFVLTSLFGHFRSKKKERVVAVAVAAHSPPRLCLLFRRRRRAAGQLGAAFPNGAAPRERPLERQRKREKGDQRPKDGRKDGRGRTILPSSRRRVLWLFKWDREWDGG